MRGLIGASVATLLVTAIGSTASAGGDALFDDASQRYCDAYARETADVMLREGPPADVALMEAAWGMLDTGEWSVKSRTVASAKSDVANEWNMTVECTWDSPFEELRGAFELNYVLKLDPATGAIKSVRDGDY